MMAFLAEYGLFLLKTMTIVAGIVIVVIVVASAGRRQQQDGLVVENLNKKFESLGESLRNAIASKDDRKKAAKEKKKKDKAEAKESSDRPRSFVIEFKGDLKARILHIVFKV